MQTCFIIQPFDNGQFDKRYNDIIKPTIEDLGLEPYRVDEDFTSQILIEDIEKGIKSSLICLADITLDNPNVWYELGFAFSANKPVIMICSKNRSSAFPFDVRHKSIIRYSTDSPRDFEELKNNITFKANALLEKKELYTKVSENNTIIRIEGLSQHELICIVAIAENSESQIDNVPFYTITSDVENSGFSKMASVIGLQSLLKNGLITCSKYEEEWNNSEYTGYKLTESGWNWILDNQDKFEMKRNNTFEQTIPVLLSDDELPF